MRARDRVNTHDGSSDRTPDAGAIGQRQVVCPNCKQPFEPPQNTRSAQCPTCAIWMTLETPTFTRSG